MNAAIAVPDNTAGTFLVHFFGTGLADERYVAERDRAECSRETLERQPTKERMTTHRRAVMVAKRTVAQGPLVESPAECNSP